MLCYGWKPFCGHKNNRKKRRMGRKPCASFLGYQNFQPRTAVSGANFELVPFEAPSIGRMPLGNPCWTLRALFAARFSECNFGSAAHLRGNPHSRCFARFYGLALCLAYVLDDGKVSSAHVLRASYPCAARPLWGTASGLYRFIVLSTLDAARSPSTVAMASPKLPLRGIRLSPLPEPSESLSGLFPRFPYSLP